jgi:hypothetical protein
MSFVDARRVELFSEMGVEKTWTGPALTVSATRTISGPSHG